MSRLIIVGLIASAFFASTFVLNRSMSLEGGHWVWTGALRYFYMTIFLSLWILLTQGWATLRKILPLFLNHIKFWILAGGIGFGLFYALLCFAASYAPGWVVACTWQSTVLATPIVLRLFGRSISGRAILFSALIFAGIILVSSEQAQQTSLLPLILGSLPVFVSAFAYPVGNQLVGEAKQGTHPRVPHIDDPLMAHASVRTLLMTIGSIPFWFLLILLIGPPPPSSGQWFQTALVALSSGLIATTLFLHARHEAVHPYEIAAVDATQAGEMLFALLGEILFLGIAPPAWVGWSGILLIVIGIVLYAKGQATPHLNKSFDVALMGD